MKTVLTFLVLCFTSTVVAESSETILLRERSAEFRKGVVQVADNVYTFTGHSVQPVSMIIGNGGLVIVDTGLDTISAQNVLLEMRKITELPIKAIVLTHGHGDHTGGVPVFAQEGSPDIWARDNFGEEGHAFQSAGLTITNVRGARQGGFMLPPDKRINNGVAKAYYPKRGGEVFGAEESLKPNRRLTEKRTTVVYAGIKLDLVSINAETRDALYVWYTDKRVLFSGDNFYKSWPNLYPIRGTAYRDVQSWADSVDEMLQENPDKLVPGHTRPVTDKALVIEMLTNYRREEAEHMAALAGGTDKLENAAYQALKNNDYQWAAQLCDQLIALSPSDAKPKRMKAEALEGLAEGLLTATGRNYYLTRAQELRKATG